MAWLDDFLAAAQQDRDALSLAAAQQGQPAATGTSASRTGGLEYPGTQQAAAAASPQAQAKASVQDLLAGYNLWAQKRRGKGQSGVEPLLANHPLIRNPNGAAAGDPLAAVAQINTNAASGREGEAYQEFGAGDRRYHVYYDPKTGKRRVVSFVLPAKS